MDLGLAGKVALVTGSSSGIGKGIAQMLAGEGVKVVIHGIDLAEATATCDAIGGAVAIAGDLTTDSGADSVTQAARSAVGHIDILVNNVGGSASGSTTLDFLDVTEAMWEETYALNVLTAVRMIRRLVPDMRDRGWGRVIQIASAASMQPLPTGADYGCAKAAVANLTVALVKSLGPCGVTVNTISPGTTLTPSLQGWIDALASERGWGDDPEERERRLVSEIVKVPSGRIGRPHNIGSLVCLLCSTPYGEYTTGANFRVDGGQVQSVN